MIDHAWIAARIPHQGSMCLLDAVDSWNEQQIVCRATSHALPDNPLRAAGSLGVANAIEYAAQAMAVHGALLAGCDGAPQAGYLTSVRDVRWQRARLDDVVELQIRAERISGNDTTALYGFSIIAAGELLVGGRAGVVFDAAALGA